MKLFIISVLFLITITISCEKADDSVWSNGLITGVDYRMCPCCGGCFIEIDSTSYRFWTIPDTTEIKLSDNNFPIPVRLKWKMKENACMGDLIDIIEMKKR